ncbi:hypothetical protein [Microbacterium rhizomatis]|uniref:Uncharacterized protein n=1 Tax=Microbacterium rhizomatis TaxID=1631477 RepID=A0A5J5IWP1_9MICO|nr:hypothetical protein [Microbacterium rhizomatis]KAA9105517.1 hypothetical protein F6B43_17220 [Microbacterium rhizomatis]
MASALAIAEIAGERKEVRPARELLAVGDFAESHVTELASELATLEFAAGRDRNARDLFRRSLIDPTENTVAQAEWADSRGLRLDTPSFDVEAANEARFRAHVRASKWQEASMEAATWQADQPFSLQAALFTSFAASIAEDWRTALHGAQVGLVAHPHDPLLLNNAAFAATHSGDIALALHYVSAARASTNAHAKLVLAATGGLIAFRTGDAVLGRHLYESAVNGLVKEGVDVAATAAAIHWATEELLAGSAGAARAVERAQELFSVNPTRENQTLMSRLVVRMSELNGTSWLN